MIDVVWYSTNPDAIARHYWDQGWLEAICDCSLWRPVNPFEFVHRHGFDELPGDARGAVVVVPGRWHVDRIEDINEHIGRLKWCLVVVTGDEEDVFPSERLRHPNMRVWKQTPSPKRIGVSAVGDFWPPDCPRLLADIRAEKSLDWSFAGQVNTRPRRTLLGFLQRLEGGSLHPTDTFGSGLPYEVYIETLAKSKVAPCPAGPFTPDTFRVFEALEAGCIPVVEAMAPNTRQPGYWRRLFGTNPPFPVISSWDVFPKLLGRLLEDWPHNANRISAWWQSEKRNLAYRFQDDLHHLSGDEGNHEAITDDITVLIPTSPTPFHPDTSAIEEVMESVRARLPDNEIVVMLDGVREEQEYRTGAYEEYRRRVLWLCEHRWGNAFPLYFEEHWHQAGMTRVALDEVRTPLILFVEHDTPLIGDIPFGELLEPLIGDRLDLIRLHHEASILPDHEHLMLDDKSKFDAPLLRTVQWSQRPHLATTAFYRRLMREYFGNKARTMIEDVMHGVVHSHWREYGLAGWERFRLAIFAPEGDIKRSGHLDTRGDDPMYPMTWRYDGETPLGAPEPR